MCGQDYEKTQFKKGFFIQSEIVFPRFNALKISLLCRGEKKGTIADSPDDIYNLVFGLITIVVCLPNFQLPTFTMILQNLF